MNRLKEFIRQCTELLSADQQVRLEAEQELSDHIEMKIAEEKATGSDEKASEERALKAFGDAPEISASLLDANIKRMNLHAKIRVFIKVAALPALLLAFFFGINFNDVTTVNTMLSLTGSNLYTQHSPDILKPKLSADEQLIVFGDKSKKGRVERQKAIWEKWPDNKIYLANYITTLYKNESKEYAKILKALRQAQKIDPDNAYYNYLMMRRMLSSAVKFSYEHIRTSKTQVKSKLKIIVKDQAMLNQAMDEFKKGLAKPYCKSYALDMSYKRAEISFSKQKGLASQIARITMFAKTYLPALNYYRNIAPAIPFYARLKAKTGDKKNAEFYLNAWKPFVKQINANTNCLLGILVNNHILKLCADEVPGIYRNLLKEPKKAEAAAKELAAAKLVFTNWRKRISDNRSDQFLRERAGVLGMSLLPALNANVDPEEIAQERRLNYLMLEKIMLAAMCLTGLVIICAVLLGIGKNYIQGTRTFLLLPSLNDFLKIIGLGIALPFTLYLLITQFDSISGREYNIIYNHIQLIFQMALFLVGIPVTLLFTVSVFIRQRCQAIGIEVPKKSRIVNCLFYVAAPLIIIFSTIPIIRFAAKDFWLPAGTAYSVLLLIVASTIGIATIVLLVWLRGCACQKRNAASLKMQLLEEFIYLMIFALVVIFIMTPMFNDAWRGDFARSNISNIIKVNAKFFTYFTASIGVGIAVAGITVLLRLALMAKQYSRYKMTLYVNLIPYIILLLLTISMLWRPYLDRREVELLSTEKSFFDSTGFTAHENRVVVKLRDALGKALSAGAATNGPASTVPATRK